MAVGKLGTPRSVSVEVTENRHELGGGTFLPLLRFGLKWNDLEVTYLQPAEGGEELLERVVAHASEGRIARLAVPVGPTREAVLAALGESSERGRGFLRYVCANSIDADEVELDFDERHGSLQRVEWRYPVE